MEEKKKVIYLSGPITGVDNYWERFEQADDILTSLGAVVLNPARLPQGMKAQNYANICSIMLLQADAVLMLSGWEDSMGASFERTLAYSTKKPTYYSIELLIKEVLEK